MRLTCMKYPPVGSHWEITPGPEISRTVVEVIRAGHGNVVVQQVGGKYMIAIDIQAWYRRYQPTRAGLVKQS